jgi:hypothetical protein
MKKLRYLLPALLLALAVLACGGPPPEQAATETPADEAPATPAVADEPEAEHVNHEQIAALLDDPDVFLLDVRDADELPEQGAIEGYTLIPVDELADRLDELPRDKKILTI